jgi:hypothetical protein
MFSPSIQKALDRLADHKGEFDDIPTGIRHKRMTDNEGWYACPLCVLCNGTVSNHHVTAMMVHLGMTYEEAKGFMKAADAAGDYDRNLRKAIREACGLAD